MAAKWALKTLIGLVVLALFLFLSAGRWDWPAGWVLIAISAVNQALVYLLVSRAHPDLLEERAAMRAGTKPWDRVLAPLMAYSGGIISLVCGFDARFGWSGMVADWVPWVGALVLVLPGVALGAWAMAVNRFFSATVRIQTDRGHTVVESGPYRFVRHPGYTAALMFDLGVPLLLSSWWGLLVGVMAVGVAFIRTRLEDRTLQAELPGYAEYAQKVRYLWIPGVW